MQCGNPCKIPKVELMSIASLHFSQFQSIPPNQIDSLVYKLFAKKMAVRLRINWRTQGPIKLHPSKMHNYCKSCFTSQKYAVPANWRIQGRKMQTYVWCRATCNLQGAASFVVYALSTYILLVLLVYKLLGPFMPCLHVFCLHSLSTYILLVLLVYKLLGLLVLASSWSGAGARRKVLHRLCLFFMLLLLLVYMLLPRTNAFPWPFLKMSLYSFPHPHPN